MATHSRILAWKIPWAGETGRLFSMGPQNWTHLSTHMPVVAYGLCAVFCICICVHPDALCPPPGAPRTKRCCGHICIEQGFLLHPPLEPDSLMEGQRPAQHPLPPPELTATRFSLLVSEPQGQGWAQLSPPSKPLQTPLMGETLPLPQDAHTGGKQPPSHAPRWLHDCGVTCPLEASMPTSEMGDKQPTSQVGSGCQ